MNIYLRVKVYPTTLAVVNFQRLGCKLKLTIRSNNDVTLVQPNKINMNEKDYGR